MLAAVAIWQLLEARKERQDGARNLALAEATFRAEQRPELIALQDSVTDPERELHLGGQGAIRKRPGEVLAAVDVLESSVRVVSFDVLNIGRGAAEIRRARLMSLDTVPRGGGSTGKRMCWSVI